MLKQQNKKIRIFIEIPAAERFLEAYVLEESNFDQCLKLLRKMLPEILPYYEIDEQTIVMEKKSMQACDRAVPLLHLHVQDGMTFLLF